MDKEKMKGRKMNKRIILSLLLVVSVIVSGTLAFVFAGKEHSVSGNQSTYIDSAYISHTSSGDVVTIQVVSRGVNPTEAIYQSLENEYPGVEVRLLDNRYNISTFDNSLLMLEEARGHIKPFQAQYNDCDDFAFSTKVYIQETYGVNGVGVAFGTLEGLAHAFNIFNTSDDGWHIWDASSGSVDPVNCNLSEILY